MLAEEDGIRVQQVRDLSDPYSITIPSPLHHNYNVTIFPDVLKKDSRTDEVREAIKTLLELHTEETFQSIGEGVEYIQFPTRILVEKLKYSPLITKTKIGSDIIRASYFHDSFHSNSLFFFTPYGGDEGLRLPSYRTIREQDPTFSFSNSIYVELFDPGNKERKRLHCSFPNIRTGVHAGTRQIILGYPFTNQYHDPEGNEVLPIMPLEEKCLLSYTNFIMYTIITEGMDREFRMRPTGENEYSVEIPFNLFTTRSIDDTKAF